ncbi:hypothetical protein [Pseudomonas sp. F01002]|uniref:hypothetical protein n=1 Tax=Pseudomonas sp. F01002 TaxID=2555724 RepID=UPI00106A7A68|nr:hypothetical protein [Pseudomonas sp. F01002]TFB36413.1 hypothetical protein E3W21_23915 [Pseudomonas sp. F01002]
MKHSAIAGLFITAAILASPAFAADKDLCAANIQKIDDFAASAPSLPESSLDNIKAAQEKSKAAQAAGNDKDCVEITTGIIKKMEIRDPTRN